MVDQQPVVSINPRAAASCRSWTFSRGATGSPARSPCSALFTGSRLVSARARSCTGGAVRLPGRGGARQQSGGEMRNNRSTGGEAVFDRSARGQRREVEAAHQRRPDAHGGAVASTDTLDLPPVATGGSTLMR